MGSAFRLYDPNDPFAIMRLRRKLEESQASDGADIPVKPGIPTPKDPIDELYENGPLADDYESYVQNVPERKSPASTDRVLAALSSALDQRPHDRFGKINEVLDRPYQQEVADYKLKGEGLRAAAGMEDRRQGKKIQRQTHLESLEERRRAEIERAADRDENREMQRANAEAQLKQRQAEAQARADDRAASLEERKAARQESNDIKRQLLDMRREQFEDKKNKENQPDLQIFDSNDQKYTMDKKTREVKPLNLPVKESDAGRNQKTNMMSLHRELKELQSEFKNASGAVKGPYMGPTMETASNMLPFNLGKHVPGQNMRSLAKRIKAEYLTATGGKSLTKSEIQLLEPYLPSFDQPDHVFNANMENFIKKAEEVLSTRYGMKPEEFGGVSAIDGEEIPGLPGVRVRRK